LFWDAVGYDDDALNLVLEIAPQVDERGVHKLCVLIGKAIARLAFSNPMFVKTLLRHFSGEARRQIVEALAFQAHRLGSGGFVGSPEEDMAQKRQEFVDKLAAFPEDSELEDLSRAMRRFS
jgi:hypothetical protein